MIVRRRFKTPELQNAYNSFRTRYRIDPAQFKHGVGGATEAFLCGLEGRACRFVRGSVAYACWAAGQDCYREACAKRADAIDSIGRGWHYRTEKKF